MVFCLIVLAVLIYSVKENNVKASAALQAKRMVCKNRRENVYTTVIFTVMNAKVGKQKAYTETKKIYAALTGVAQEFCSNPL